MYKPRAYEREFMVLTMTKENNIYSVAVKIWQDGLLYIGLLIRGCFARSVYSNPFYCQWLLRYIFQQLNYRLKINTESITGAPNDGFLLNTKHFLDYPEYFKISRNTF